MSAYAVQTINDGVLGVVAPIGLAGARGTALVVDMVDQSPRQGVTLAKLVSLGPTRAQLGPQNKGVAFLANGGVSLSEAEEVVNALRAGWPHLVIRTESQDEVPKGIPRVVVEAVLSGPFAAPVHGSSVLQPTGLASPPKHHGGPLLARLSSRRVRALLKGQMSPRWAWIRSWQRVLEAM